MDKEGPFRQIAPDQLEVREGGGCVSLFGLPFLAAGVFVTLIGIQVVPIDNAQDVLGWAWPLMILMGLVFAGVGIGLVFGRNWTVIDKTLSKVSKRWGLLVPLRKREHYLHEYDAILLRFDKGDSETSDQFPLLLRGKHGVDDLILSNPAQYGESRRGAAQVARLLNLPLVDATTDHDTVIQTAAVEDTLQERLETVSQGAGTVPRPLEMKSRIETSGETVHIEIPGHGFRPTSLMGLILPAAILFVVVPHLAEFFRETDTPRYVQYFFFGFLLFFFGAIPFFGTVLGAIRSARSRTSVTVSADGIAIEERGVLRSQKTWISAEDIFGLDFGTVDSAWESATARRRKRYSGSPGQGFNGSAPISGWLKWVSKLAKSKGITVKSGRGFFVFGAGLPDDEVRYLHWIVKAALGSGTSEG